MRMCECHMLYYGCSRIGPIKWTINCSLSCKYLSFKQNCKVNDLIVYSWLSAKNSLQLLMIYLYDAEIREYVGIILIKIISFRIKLYLFTAILQYPSRN